MSRAFSLSEVVATRSRYPHVVQAVFDRPWAILPAKFLAIIEILEARVAGQVFTAMEMQERLAAARPAGEAAAVEARAQGPGGAGGGAIAVLPLLGIMAHRMNLMAEHSGGTSTQAFGVAFDAAINNPDVQAVVLDVDSPGGESDGLPELAAKIRAARGEKPIVAVVNTMAASAAYWVAAQADEVVITPSGQAGSIGTLMIHEDISGALEAEGVKVTLISAGRFKTEGNPFEPLGDEARDQVQATVDEVHAMFVSDVAKGRGVSASAVRGGFGEGRMLLAKAALAAGMADRIDTLDATLRRLSGRGAGRRGVRAGPAAEPMESQIAAAYSRLREEARDG